MNVDLIVRNECVCVGWEEIAPWPLFIPARCARTDRQEIPVYILNFPYPLRHQHHHHYHPRSAATWSPAQACSECQRFISSLWRCHAALPMSSLLRVSVCVCVSLR
jgi:hypothetical protein